MGKQVRHGRKRPTYQKTSTTSELQIKMKQKLEGAKFRMLNEQLYTTTGSEAYDTFQDDPELFDVYHQGFREQVHKWPVNPLDQIIAYINKRSKTLVVGDFGCGDAQLSDRVANTVHSFDLVSRKANVVACDIAKVPLEDESLDIAVYCLSLMGTNVTEYMTECRRVLKTNGRVKIAEVKSRFADGVQRFVQQMKQLGFALAHKDESNKMFVLLDFTKLTTATGQAADRSKVHIVLKPCEYKRR